MQLIGLFVTLVLVSGCHRDQDARGPMERAGQGLDTAADKTGTALKGATVKTGEGLEKAAHSTGHAFQRVGDKLGGKGGDTKSQQPAAAPKKTTD
jgi:hypothetical protein